MAPDELDAFAGAYWRQKNGRGADIFSYFLPARVAQISDANKADEAKSKQDVAGNFPISHFLQDSPTFFGFHGFLRAKNNPLCLVDQPTKSLDERRFL